MKKELLIKYLNSQCTEAEIIEFFVWTKTDALNEEGKTWGSEIWDTLHTHDDIDIDENFTLIFEKIQDRINQDNPNSERAKKSVPLARTISWITKAAAILLIPVLTILLYTLSEKKIQSDGYAGFVSDSLEVIAPIGSKTIVHLSDGSEVQLNYGSKIKYPHFFSGDSRDVALTGEGFFKVAHNPQKPFIVRAKNLNIKAVGTTFNVLAYLNSDIIETTLVSGKVILEQVEKNGNIENIGAMTPGMHVNINSLNGSLAHTDGNIEKYISWTEGKLIFEDTPIYQVAERLSRMYNIDFKVDDKVKDYIYTVTFSDEPLFQILDLMTIATPIVYKTLPRTKLPDGTFSKQKIILEKRK